MQYVSHRSRYAYESPIRKLMVYANEAMRSGKKIHFLNIGQPDVAAPVKASETITDWEIDYVPYGRSEGEETTRRAFRQYYASWGIDLDTDDIMVTMGASEALMLSLFAITDEGDEMIVQEPFYANYNGISRMAGVHIKSIYTPFEEGFPLPTVQDFEAVITEKTRALLLCNPNNPTGKVYDKEMLLQLAELVLKHDLYLIVDEVYREFCYDSAFHSVLNIDHIKDRVIVLDSISKRYNSCGARIGCIVTKNKEVHQMALKYAQLRLSPPMLGQRYAEKIINPPAPYMKNMISEFRKRRDYIMERLHSIPGIKINAPDGAFYIFAELPVDDTEDFCKWMLTDFQYKNETVMLAPGNGFYATEGRGNNKVRLAYVLEHELLERAMDCLEEGLKQYPRTINRPEYMVDSARL